MTVPANGHVPSAAGAINRTPSFAPITPVVKERVGDVATRLSDVERIIEDINLLSSTSTARSPTMGDLQQEIDLLRKDVEQTKTAQKKQIDGIRGSVKDDVKEQIAKTMRAEIEKKIRESVEAQVKITVGEWGNSDETRKFVVNLNGVIRENAALCREAQIRLENSRSRHENSMLDEHADFEADLSKIRLPDGNISRAFPRTLKALFSYDENQLVRLLNEHGLQTLDTHLENLNRFLAFIGLRFSIPEQSLDFLDTPPAYTSSGILEPSKEDNATEVSQVPPPSQQLPPPNQQAPPSVQTTKTAEVIPEDQQEPEKTIQGPIAVNNAPVQSQPQEKPPEKQWHEVQADSEKNCPQQGHIAQGQAGIELSTLARQPPPVITNYQPQPATPTNSLRSTDRLSPTALPFQPSSPQVGNLVSGWLKSFKDNF